MKAIYSRPLGFSDKPYAPDEEVDVVGYVAGYHEDMRDYDRGGKGIMAICIRVDGSFEPIPLIYLSRKQNHPNG